MTVIRFILGKLILFFNWAFPPKGIKRRPKQQAQIDLQTASLTLYQYKACPFCVKVRRAMKRQSLSIETRDVKRSETARGELLAGGRDHRSQMTCRSDFSPSSSAGSCLLIWPMSERYTP